MVQICPRHFSPEQAALIEDLDARGTAVGVKRNPDAWHGMAWPYGPNVQVPMRLAMIEWAEKHKLSLVYRQKLSCACWPTSSRVSKCDCGPNGVKFAPDSATWDHVTRWKARRGGRAVVVLQPYRISDEGWETLTRWNDREDVAVEVRPDSWYGIGTLFVGIWNAEAAPAGAGRLERPAARVQ